jgi:hypothetical protein
LVKLLEQKWTTMNEKKQAADGQQADAQIFFVCCFRLVLPGTRQFCPPIPNSPLQQQQ